ncbi:uncharacterized protein LOC124358495 [Homalodisca vitripennis]|uniref:uncharacterized protein LOC124358495 n=1 Tax=Homalodisca vitripennis TaxID=197043 RepID=UPI001EEB1CC4|nr:uncharacterized protein LOC124358495 [Homalodisca vitripennis]
MRGCSSTQQLVPQWEPEVVMVELEASNFYQKCSPPSLAVCQSGGLFLPLYSGSTEHNQLVCLVLQPGGEFENYFELTILSFLNDDQLLELLENSDLEDFDIDEEDVPQLQLAVANEMEADPQRCPSPLNSDIPLQVRMEQEKLRQRWRIKPWETPIVAPIIELPVEELLGPSEYFGR